MCGICGALDTRGELLDSELVSRMTASLRHRGPDGAGSHFDNEIGLGHRRLSIIDLDAGGQPMSNEDGTLHVVFNGEIYNFVELREELERAGHIFRTHSDTEVIVHAYERWGADCVSRFNGMFAFALWDARRRTLLLARDHLGIKPLYYTRVGALLLFASEIKGLLVCPGVRREVDLNALGTLFTLRYVPSPDTLFAGISKLPPGHTLVARNGVVRVNRFWTAVPEPVHARATGELVEQYRALLDDAVRLQMRSDVPVGLFLSSGVDSGALLALMARNSSRPIQTFTIGFEQGERTNETVHARQLAAAFGAEHREWIIGPRDYEKYYQRYLLDVEEPVGNETAAAFYFVSRLASRTVKVALTGQGADEPWAGYHRHLGMKFSLLCDRFGVSDIFASLSRAAERHNAGGRLTRGLWCLRERDILSRLIAIYSFYSAEMKQQLFQPWLQDEIGTGASGARRALHCWHDDVRHLDPLTRMLYIDTRTNLSDDLLMVGDKTAMANSLEARVPFLDYRLVQFVESLKPTVRLHGLNGKYLHKRAMLKWLPREVVYRKKKGFENPIDKWLQGSMFAYLKDSLLSERAAVRLYFDPTYIRRLLEEHQSGAHDHLRHLYLLLSFEQWHQRFISAASSAPDPREIPTPV